MMEHVIFLHILKCGGTSMLHMLYEQYGVGYFHPVPISTVQKVVSYPSLRGVDALSWQKQINVQTADWYGCIAGHYDWGLVERLPNWQVVVMLRHPVDQLRSLYQYMARSFVEHQELSEWMTEIGFEGWIRSDHARTYFNGQTTYLSGHHVRNGAKALANLQQARVTFGLVERYAESVALFNRTFGWQMTEQHRHKSENVVALDDETFKFVEQLQADDMKLYQWACANFERQFENGK